MSTITGEFTKEQLIARADHLLCVGKAFIADHPGYDEMAKDVELFKIALASLEAEPVHQVYGNSDDTWSDVDEEEMIRLRRDGEDTRTLYSAPSAPVSVPDDVLKGLLPDAEKAEFWFEHDGKILFEGVKFNNAVFDAIRAAMLQGAEPVTTANELRDAIEIIRNSGIEIDAEKIFAERDALNSPVIPDGWVACSEKMPEENSEQEVLACFKGGDISTLYYFEGRWDDAYGIVPIRQDVTHWMPLPAAPQQEVTAKPKK